MQNSVRVSATVSQGSVLLVFLSLVMACCTREFLLTLSGRAEVAMRSRGLAIFLE